METLRTGIIGCGGMGQAHISTMRDIGSISIVAVSDPVASNVAEAAEMVDHPNMFADHVSLLEDPEIQAVVVATPNFLHREVTIAALEAGKDVLCEKPMALNVRDCDEMWDAALRHGRKLMTGQVLRLMHPFVQMREFLASGEIGAPRSANIERISGSWVFSLAKTDQWRMSRHKTGGLLYEINAHELDLLRSIFGEPTRIYANSINVVSGDHDYEDTNLVMTEFDSGSSATLYGSSASGFSRTHGIVLCTEGSVSYGWGDDSRNSLQYCKFGDDQPTVIDVPHDPKAGLRAQAQNFANWVLKDTVPEVTGWDGRQAVAMAEMAYESARTNLPVELTLGTGS